ncbi:unnamed protein product, partial [Rotaria sp. Silwood1]
MSTSELHSLKESIGQFISINSFFSTSRSPDIAYEFLGITANSITIPPTGFEYVFFEIDADPNLSERTSSFADISEFSYFDEGEILFMFGSMFRLNNARCDSNNPHINFLSMSLCGNDDEQLNNAFSVMKKEYLQDGAKSNSEGEEPTLISLSIVLLNMGYLTLANKFLSRMLKTLKYELDAVDIGKCYLYIGDVYRQKGDFRRSRYWYAKALKTFARVFPNDDYPSVAATYMSLGHSYSKITDWKLAS